MYRVKPQAVAAALRARNDSEIQVQADDLKVHVQEFTDQVLDMADTPPSTSTRAFPQRGNRVEKYRGAYVEEPLIPALIYITVAGMAGSIIARKSNFVFRFLSPAALGLGAAAYCIPKTTNNVLHGLRAYDYSEIGREWKHKYNHTKQSIVDATHELKAVAGSVAEETNDAVSDLSDKTQEIASKTQKVVQDVKDKTYEVAHDLKDKGEDVAKDVQSKSQYMGHQLESAKDQAKETVEDKAGQARQWWNSEKKSAENSANDMKRAMRAKGEQARDWAENAREDGRDWAQEKAEAMRGGTRGFDKEDMERGFDRFKSKARQNWDYGRDEFQDGRSRGAREMKDQAKDWAQDRSREMRGGFDDMRDRAQNYSRNMRDRFDETKDRGEDWAQDRQRDARKLGREARDFAEDRYRDAQRDVRGRTMDMQNRGRREFQKLEGDFEYPRSRSYSRERGRTEDGWGFGSGRPGEDDGRRGRIDRREEFAGHRGRGYDSDMPHRSVMETAREGKHWWQPKDAADTDSYASYDSRPSPQSSSWWKAGSASKDQTMDQFDHAKHHAQRGMDHLKDSVEEKAKSGRAWFAGKTDDMKQRFEHTKHQVDNGFHRKFARDAYSGGEQGRDFGGHGYNHASIYSNDNWFHYDHGEDNRSSASRGRQRGM
ncbi:hypothetical protein BGZ98_007546 [Dissophora globulifera]|nr:hypothetical protein BGZ98_007546 [Dissophora globulifera]